MARRVLLVAVCLLALAANRPDPQVARTKSDRLKNPDEMADISGYYVCRGKEGSGKAYSGVTVITKKNDLYVIHWTIGSGGTFTGVAIRQGDTLAASWAIPADKAGVIRGVNLYRIEPGPRLVGRWATIPGPGHIQTETLTFLKNIETEEE